MQNERSPQRISVIEQLSPRRISISWSDPCMGRYTDQIWRIGFAQTEARCMLTGAPIRRGDSVFRPRSPRSHMPINHNRMILVSAVADLLPEFVRLKTASR